jgi:putative transposase
LKHEYRLGSRDRLRLEVAGDPNRDREQGRLELYYDEVADTFKTIQSVVMSRSRRD